MIFAVSILLVAGLLAFVLLVRPQDVPDETPESPIQHLEDRRAIIYDNLRDLNFEYRLGKLSDADYNKTKVVLQNELAQVLAAIDKIAGGAKAAPAAAPAAAPKAKAAKAEAPAPPDPFVCPHCGAKFEKTMKFCGECGKAMSGVEA
ncbi:MAG: zinc ribbon domain-containing protein [Acidobacteria bacterium]|nr:zinc ribbon domain-containing protein [Acidobacteriota bacterium]